MPITHLLSIKNQNKMKKCNGLYDHWKHFKVKKKRTKMKNEHIIMAFWAPKGPQPNFFQNCLLRLNHLSIKTNEFKEDYF